MKDRKERLFFISIQSSWLLLSRIIREYSLNDEICWTFDCWVDWTFDDSARNKNWNVRKTNVKIDVETNVKVDIDTNAKIDVTKNSIDANSIDVTDEIERNRSCWNREKTL